VKLRPCIDIPFTWVYFSLYGLLEAYFEGAGSHRILRKPSDELFSTPAKNVNAI
jgi:hypothetical protein